MRHALLLLVMLVLGGVARANPIATIDRTEMYVGDMTTYTVTHSRPITPVGLPTSDNDGVLILHSPTPSTSTFQQIDNRGTNITRHSISWQFRARGEGAFSILPFTVLVDGVEHLVPEVTGNVVPSPTGGNDGRPVHNDRNIESQLRGMYFTRLEPSDPQPVPGQAVVLKTYLYRLRTDDPHHHSISVDNVRVDPAVLLVENSAQVESRLVDTEIEIDGQRWLRSALHQMIVVPTRAGKVDISGPQVGVTISRTGARDPFFSRGSLGFRITQPMAELDVQPTPATPDGAVSQVVGNVTVGVTAEPREVQEGDLVTVTIRYSGEGYFATAGVPGFPRIEGLSLVGEPTSFVVSRVYPTPISTREIRRVYQTVRPGTIRIPALEFAVVDPATKRIDMQASLPIEITVAPSPHGSVRISDGGNGEPTRAGVREFDRAGISFIDTGRLSSRTLSEARAPLWRRPAFWFAHGAALAGAVMLALFFGLVQHRLSRESELLQVARRHSKNAMERAWAHAQTDAATFHAEVAEAIYSAANAALGGGATALTAEDLAARLRLVGIAETDAAAMRSLLEECQAARYAPAHADAQTARKLTEAERLVTLLIKHAARSDR